MKFWKTAAVAMGIVAAAGLGAVLTPAIHGQTRSRIVAPRAAEVFFGGGSRLGVSITDVSADDSKTKGSLGVLIDDVDEDSPAAKAGLKKGDIVVEFDGERVRSARQFTRLVSETPAGRTVTAAVMRDGQRVSLSVTPREGNNFRFFDEHNWVGDGWVGVTPPPPPPAPSAPRPPSPPRAVPPPLETFVWRSGNRLGISIEDLSPQLAEYFGTKEGVLVSSVEADSAAAKAGLKAGDVITTVNGSTVGSSSELRRRLSSADPGEEFSLGIIRDKRAMTLKGKFENPPDRRRTTRTVL